MRTALLTTQPIIKDWFSKAYPEVEVFEAAEAGFLASETLIITSWYEINETFFQIVFLWDKYLRLRNKGKKLIVLGWLPARHKTNYLQVGEMPDRLDEWIRAAERSRTKPSYPQTANKDILKDLERILHSHGARAFQKLLVKAQGYLRRVERNISEGNHRDFIREMEEMKILIPLMNRINSVWEERQGYFQLMPQYQGLKQFEELWQLWIVLRDRQVNSSPKLSQQIGTYVNDVIIEDFLRLYGIKERS